MTISASYGLSSASAWYITKTAPSFADMRTKLRHVIIAAQFRPGQG